MFFTLIITAFDTIHFVPKFKAAAFVEYLLPHSRDELRWFTALSVTAGVCVKSSSVADFCFGCSRRTSGSRGRTRIRRPRNERDRE